MPTLPDAYSAVGVVTPQSDRPIASYQGGQVGQAIEQAGVQGAKVADEMQDTQDKLDDGFARSHLTTKMIQFAKEDENNPDIAGAPQRWNDNLAAATQEAAGMFSRPQTAKLFTARAGLDTASLYSGFLQNVDTKRRDQGVASVLNAGEQESRNFVDAPDPNTQASVAARYGSILDNAASSGLITATEAEKQKKEWHATTADALIQQKLWSGDIDGAKKFYEANKTYLPMGTQMQLERAMHTEGMRVTGSSNADAILSGGDLPASTSGPTSSINPYNLGNVKTPQGAASNTAQFAQPASPADGVTLTANTLRNGYQGLTLQQIGAKWAPSSENNTSDWVKNVSAGSGISPSTVPNLDDPATLKNLLTGIATAEKSPQDRLRFTDDVLTQGISDSLAGKQPQTSEAAAPPTGKPVSFQPGASPVQTLINLDKAYPDALNRAMAIPNIDERSATISALEQRHTIYKAAADAWKTEIQSQVGKLSMDPNFTSVDQIPQEIKAKLVDSPTSIEFLQKAANYNLERGSGASTKDMREYGTGFYDAFKSIHAPSTDPGRITDITQLQARVGPKGDLTMAGYDKLSKELAGKNTPDGEAEGMMKKQFLANAKGQITGSDEANGFKDPRGDELFLKFMAHALPAYEQGKAQGKSAIQLLNPDSPDYIGKGIPSFKRPLNERIADMTQDLGGVAGQRTAESIFADIRSGKITKDQGKAEGIKLGLFADKPNSPPVPRPE
jgi:hypothetical protein